MATYTAHVSWTLKSGQHLLKGRFSRGYIVSLDGGIVAAHPFRPTLS
jgi:hypothetical protein